MPSPRLRAMAPAAVAAMEAAPPPVEEARAFRFCRLFPDLEKFQPDDAGLIALGQAWRIRSCRGRRFADPGRVHLPGPVCGPRHHV